VSRYAGLVGRPRVHDQATARALLRAAERIVDAEGVDALSVRRVAREVGTTTRAVYSVFGSKEALLGALGQRAFEILGAELDALPTTSDPAADLVGAGLMFRRFALEHRSLLQIGFQHVPIASGVAADFRPTQSRAFAGLIARVTRLQAAGGLGGRPVMDAVLAFDALTEGLATIELRGTLAPGREEALWRDALEVLVRGFARAAGGGNNTGQVGSLEP
jgi:AcrR family transcriptional regulator